MEQAVQGKWEELIKCFVVESIVAGCLLVRSVLALSIQVQSITSCVFAFVHLGVHKCTLN